MLILMVPSFFSSSHQKDVYIPKDFFPHAALLRQGCPHCGKVLAAASRRSLGRVAVPVWLVNLSIQLPVVALVGFYPANKLIGQRSLSERIAALLIT